MTDLEIIIGIEETELHINTIEELRQVQDLCYKLSFSQGFYERLYNELRTVMPEDLPIIL